MPYPIAKISKVKDLALILLISAFSRKSLHILSKKHFKPLFCFFTHLPFMRYSSSVLNPNVVTCNGAFYWRLFMSLRLTKNILREDKLFYYHCLKFSFKSTDISTCYARKQNGSFFSETQCCVFTRVSCPWKDLDEKAGCAHRSYLAIWEWPLAYLTFIKISWWCL